jgi:gas vesicle protein GvpN
VSRTWVDNRLTTACKYGFTLLYDEFNRSRPEANNVLLGILEERLLELPSGRSSENVMKVHPGFSALFTSNPEEYAGVHKTQDALMDRMITVKLGHHDRATEIAITSAKSGLPGEVAEVIVDLVRGFRGLGVNNHRPTVRACIMIARVVALRGASVSRDDRVFREICHDVLSVETLKITRDGETIGAERIDELIHQHCLPHGRKPSRNGAAHAPPEMVN